MEGEGLQIVQMSLWHRGGLLDLRFWHALLGDRRRGGDLYLQIGGPTNLKIARLTNNVKYIRKQGKKVHRF